MNHVNRNATNRKQIEESKKKQKRLLEEKKSDLRKVLQTREGRNVMWRFLEEARVFNSIWEPSAKIHYNAGKQDFGHYLMAEIMNSDPDKYLLMVKENKEKNGEQ